MKDIGIDINDLSTLARLSQAAVARMQTWYKGGQIPPYQFRFPLPSPSLTLDRDTEKKDDTFRWTGWWQAPVLGIAYTNLDLALGNRANELVARDLLTRNDHGTEWMIDKYVDDQSEYRSPFPSLSHSVGKKEKETKLIFGKVEFV